RLLSAGAETDSALAEALVAVLELLHPTGGVEYALLAGVERLRSRRDLDVEHRVGVAVFPLDCLLARGGCARTELGAGCQLVDHDRCVLRVDVLLHILTSAEFSQAPGMGRPIRQCPNSSAGHAPNRRNRTRSDSPF